MRGKKPKERKQYILRIRGDVLVEVTREVYLAWHQFRRRERYQRERDFRHGVYSLEGMEGTGCFPAGLTEGIILPEEAAIKSICLNKFREILEELPEQDLRLLRLLYYEETSVKKAAQICGCSRKAIQNQRKRIFDKLRRLLREQGIEDAFSE